MAKKNKKPGWFPAKPSDQMNDQELQQSPLWTKLQGDPTTALLPKMTVKQLARKAIDRLYERGMRSKTQPIVQEFIEKLKAVGYSVGPKGLRIQADGTLKRVIGVRMKTGGKRGRPRKDATKAVA